MYSAQQEDLQTPYGGPLPLATSIDDALTAHVEDALADYLSKRQSTLTCLAPPMAEALDALAGFVLGGGKRIRPTFAWWGWRCVDGEPDGERARAVLHAVSGLELIQACALVHDDVMDASDVRRGAPTVHVAFADIHRSRGWLGRPERFGLAAAILLGDIALAWADDMFYDLGCQPIGSPRRANRGRVCARSCSPVSTLMS